MKGIEMDDENMEQTIFTKEELDTIKQSLLWYHRDGMDWHDKAINLYNKLTEVTID